MANVVTNPTANQTITAFDLNPASGNTTQSLGISGSAWNAVLGQTTISNLNNVIYVDGIKYTTIQAAINALPSTGGLVFIPAGTYTISSAITIPNSNIVLQGAAKGATIIQSNQSLVKVMDMLNTSNPSSAWSGTNVTVSAFDTQVYSQTINTSNPWPARNTWAASFLSTASGTTVSRSFSPVLNISGCDRIGFWICASINGAASVTFFISDGTNSENYSVSPSSIYNDWIFVQISISGSVNLSAITSMGFSNLAQNVKYNVSDIRAWLSTNDFAAVTVNGQFSCVIRDLQVTHLTHTGQPAISIPSTNGGCAIENVFVQYGTYNVYSGGSRTRILNCDLQYPAGIAIRCDGVKARIIGNSITNTPSDSIWLTNAQGYCSGNDIDTSSGCGIVVNGGSSTVVLGNTIQNIEIFGVEVTGAQHCTVSSNTILGCNETGVQLLQNCNGTVVIGNAIYNIGKNGIDTNSGSVAVVGNVVDTTAFGRGAWHQRRSV